MDQMGLKRSEVSFRRQGSSGLVWDDRFLSGELNKIVKQHEQEQEQDRDNKLRRDQDDRDATRPPKISVTPALERSQSNGGGGGGGGRGYRASTGRVSPAVEPPSPRLSACGFCSAFRKPPANAHHNKTRKHANKNGKRKTR
ncbi:uncharacterized protein At1g15400-like [Rhodamnia argentea]|uniref:Uncharacterized protein At1g15400-like n=1 Tax=Rhodamnia argentea TaxID=178133 RepID=A0A8B8NVD3_9MYRT|nr:uncharacterized protein At1g15400-like [Rhodamnia argentea]